MTLLETQRRQAIEDIRIAAWILEDPAWDHEAKADRIEWLIGRAEDLRQIQAKIEKRNAKALSA